MKRFYIRLVNIIIGLFLYALGIALSIKANIGYSPWDVLQVGLASTIGVSYGIVSISVGLVLIIIVKIMGEKIGFGTILNMLLIGIFIDIIFRADVIPKMNNFLPGLIMLIIGLFTIAIGSFFYIKTAFGAGPRDSLMVVLARKTKIPVGICRSIIELTVTLLGWLLGGMVGAGTVISVIGIGFCIQLTFKALRFDVKAVKHETFGETFAFLIRKRK